jgi:hypothetical protein
VEHPSAFKELRLRRRDQCGVCGAELETGAQARWYPQEKVTTCIGCGLEAFDVVSGHAGASAQREYDRRRTAREERARARLGRLGVGIARVAGEPQSTEAWKRGADGEALAGTRLERHLAASGVRLLHDRRVPRKGRANIDHIAVGPGGVTVIDAKNYRGDVRVQRVGGLISERRAVLLINGRDQTHLIDGVENQVAMIRQLLAETMNDGVDVRGALCMAEVDGLPLIRQLSVRGILIDGPKPVAKLARRPGSLTELLVEEIWRALATSLPEA